MTKSHLLASALGLALIAGPALAQQADAPMRRDMPMQNGAMPMPAPAGEPNNRTMGHGTGAAEDGMHRRHGRMHNQRAAARAENRMDAGQLVQQAKVALRAGRTAEASDLLEQSETRLLTRSAPSDRAGEPAQGRVVERLAAARGAIRARDRAGALREMDEALAGLRMAGTDAGAGASSMGDAPSQGSGPGWGGQTMRDGGSAAATRSRADAIIRVQGSGSSGSGGLSGSTPGSPGVGNPGSTPGTGMGTRTQPGQGSALPGSGMSPGTGAPPPGATAPQQGGGTGVMGQGGTIRPGSTPSGGGTGSNPSR